MEIAKLCWENDEETVEFASSFRPKTFARRQTVRCDLRINEDILLAAEIVNGLPHINQFFWVAGRIYRGPFAKTGASELLAVADVNFRGALPIVLAAWKKMIATSSGGSFVIVASSAGEKPKADEAVYVATKHAQVGLARSLGLENSNSRLSVCLVMPGGMNTGLWANYDVPEISEFSDPSCVAKKIYDVCKSTSEQYFELVIPRGLQSSC